MPSIAPRRVGTQERWITPLKSNDLREFGHRAELVRLLLEIDWDQSVHDIHIA